MKPAHPAVFGAMLLFAFLVAPGMASASQTLSCKSMSCNICPSNYSQTMRNWCNRCCAAAVENRPREVLCRRTCWAYGALSAACRQCKARLAN
jgi:hypothetical protein